MKLPAKAISVGLPMLLSDIKGHTIFAERQIAKYFSLDDPQSYSRSIRDIIANYDLIYSFEKFLNYKQENNKKFIVDKWTEIIRQI